MGKQAPAPENYKGAAEQQGQSSQTNTQAQTQANRPNQSNSFASSQWTQNPDGTWTQKSGLTPEMQAKFDAMGQLDPSLFGPIDNGSAIREKTTQAAYDEAVKRLNPQWEQRDNALRSQLANQGLDPNSAAARNANVAQAGARNDAYTSAMANAISEGNRAGSEAFRDNMAARQQALMNALRQRYLPFEDASQAMGLFGQQGFNQAGRADATQYLPASMAQGENTWRSREYEDQANADAWRGAFDLLGGMYNMGKPFSF